MTPEEVVEVQNKAREMQLAELFGLTPLPGRAGADARDTAGNEYELKSGTKAFITTTRDVGPHTLERYRTRYWISARGRNLATGFVIDEVYFLAPAMLEEWFESIEQRYFAKDRVLAVRALGALKAAGFGAADLQRLHYLINRGMTLNNPKIPWHYVVSHGTRIDLAQNPREQLARLVRQHPLRT